jgi:hypothetical protein
MNVIMIDELNVPLGDGRLLALSNVEIEYNCAWNYGEVYWIAVRSFGNKPWPADNDGQTELDKGHWLFKQLACYIEAEDEINQQDAHCRDHNAEHSTYRSIGGRVA